MGTERDGDLSTQRTSETVHRSSGRSFVKSSYNLFFSSTVVEEKRIDFVSLTQEHMSVVEYHARFLALERFPPRSFWTER